MQQPNNPLPSFPAGDESLFPSTLCNSFPPPPPANPSPSATPSRRRAVPVAEEEGVARCSHRQRRRSQPRSTCG
ncbi:unnamed protein product [Linum trigynum]|uniref:Uncharacterized protein n=1 Tax=Linum trigynum TaxID=586398 RepID=A0AAV2FXA7_9ROSI